MKKLQNRFYDFLYFLYRLVSPILDPLKLIYGVPRYFSFCFDLVKYLLKEGREPFNIFNLYPVLHEKTQFQSFDSHYFYQDIWAFKKIYESGIAHHVDVGSNTKFIGLLSSITEVTYVDIRPFEATLDNFISKKGDLLSLPFENDSVQSISCLHVAEHIGLGRYGDPLDPKGTEKAAKELSRVLSKNGNLFFSLPIGKTKLCFNAHRIHSPQQIIDFFCDLKLVEFSGIDDETNYKRNIAITELENANYACGLFWFTK